MSLEVPGLSLFFLLSWCFDRGRFFGCPGKGEIRGAAGTNIATPGQKSRAAVCIWMQQASSALLHFSLDGREFSSVLLWL